MKLSARPTAPFRLLLALAVSFLPLSFALPTGAEERSATASDLGEIRFATSASPEA